jgi:hypothetical protein
MIYGNPHIKLDFSPYVVNSTTKSLQEIQVSPKKFQLHFADGMSVVLVPDWHRKVDKL